MKLKEIDIKAIFAIAVISMAIGLLYNFLSGNGIPLIKEELKIDMAADSLFVDSLVHVENSKIPYIDTTDKVLPDSLKKNNIPLTPNTETKIKEPLGIKLTQAYSLFNSKKAIFIDARDRWDFAEGHVEGALNIPDYSFDKNDPIVKGLSKNATYVIYCDGDDCEASIKLSKELAELGFTNLYVFFGGWIQWQTAGYPSQTSSIDE